ncbi:bifunctional 4-hydroxy-2-oxoglutarate aldolase/2-dehydro-3-deoxy-phosphogluconate aldolase [Algiphilus sp. W345]|uniref:Bifunctional 4-hydroxy-2-oxoglutarate aldolase/2-dehydro-3-deoxy-phosphogluconate aldolase n=1 Tax=Banduia mediterranea TaxID=3075609 RepID=A0ABU2WLW9_9GAMM|nr:bifunctional 4-hydroxy-2-oxoglutarate aldolase/2-dehydro-3-deoxy-phosphogluconate aldolase [Algiphilus sp. W345]MDT0498614.1 bifunctional 4-hydroxy-2-oxoglutarate aldolase/2-dehydro-3-deoxy-phosphogluconate aldolase [Algiphilus sp. W345]
MNARELLAVQPVIPVMVIDDLDTAVPLARALVDGGVRLLEITMRTPAALEATRRIVEEVPNAIVGVGTLTTIADIALAIEAGASFGVSPGATPALLAAARDAGLPLLPGVMTPSDILSGLAEGYDTFKFFPAQQAGGMAMLKAFHGPFPDLVFCPTGGIDVSTAPQFLALPNVACVGGSWLAPKSAVQARDWPAITRLAAETQALRRS